MEKQRKPVDLHLNVKGIYFDAIKAGNKKFEYRLRTEYWKKRLCHPCGTARKFDRVFIKKGYPKIDDRDRILVRSWQGTEYRKITHPHFGPDPVEVFAIRVN